MLIVPNALIRDVEGAIKRVEIRVAEAPQRGFFIFS